MTDCPNCLVPLKEPKSMSFRTKITRLLFKKYTGGQCPQCDFFWPYYVQIPPERVRKELRKAQRRFKGDQIVFFILSLFYGTLALVMFAAISSTFDLVLIISAIMFLEVCGFFFLIFSRLKLETVQKIDGNYKVLFRRGGN
jgi:hypothetical protein